MKNNESKTILEIQGLKKYFFNNGRVNKAVDGVSFDLKAGEIVGLIGESGSGKTTVGRSLLRLYDDFNGFVTLEDKIISGSHISHKRNKFLRKNIQMIFQDPHASLNGQKTIFSILKEPLIVNKIIKQKTNDLFSDWEDIKENFEYTFLQKAKELKIQNLRSINSLAKEFFAKWTDIFIDFSFDWENNSVEDNFISYFNYLEEKQKMESEIINNMYSNTDELIAFYYEKQAMFRSEELTDDEKELLESKKELEKTEQLTKMSLNKYQALNKKKRLEAELAEARSNFNDECTTANGAYSNFINECINDKKIAWYSKVFTHDVNFYLFNYKKQQLFKRKLQYLKEWKKKLKYLNIDQIKELIYDLEKYNELFFQKYLEEVPLTRNYKNTINYIISENYNFDYSKFIISNTNSIVHYEENIARLKKEINECILIIKVNDEPALTLQDLEKAKQRHIKAEQDFENEQIKYAQKIKDNIKSLDLQINTESLQYKKLKSQQTYTDRWFQGINEKFFKKVQADYKAAKKSCNKKDQKQVEALKNMKKSITMYKDKISGKLSTLKSFQIEVKYLFKDVKTIYLLLGVNNSKFKFLSKMMISNLLTKSIIYKTLEDVGLLKQFAYRYPHEFSGGQRQRIVIARALITEPKVIVADEPIASLDISIQAQVVNLLKDLCEKKNIGLIFIAHDLSMIEYIADRVQIMHLGKIVESGDTKKVYDKPMHPYTINLFKAIPKMSNANEKFENINFELNYLKAQQYPNVPKTYLVEPDHYIFGTKSQVEEWIAPFNLANPQLMHNTKEMDAEDTTHLPFDGRKEIPEDIEYTLLMNSAAESAEIKISDFSLETAETHVKKAKKTKTAKPKKVKKTK